MNLAPKVLQVVVYRVLGVVAVEVPLSVLEVGQLVLGASS